MSSFFVVPAKFVVGTGKLQVLNTYFAYGRSLFGSVRTLQKNVAPRCGDDFKPFETHKSLEAHPCSSGTWVCGELNSCVTHPRTFRK